MKREISYSKNFPGRIKSAREAFIEAFVIVNFRNTQHGVLKEERRLKPVCPGPGCLSRFMWEKYAVKAYISAFGQRKRIAIFVKIAILFCIRTTKRYRLKLKNHKWYRFCFISFCSLFFVSRFYPSVSVPARTL